MFSSLYTQVLVMWVKISLSFFISFFLKRSALQCGQNNIVCLNSVLQSGHFFMFNHPFFNSFIGTIFVPVYLFLSRFWFYYIPSTMKIQPFNIKVTKTILCLNLNSNLLRSTISNDNNLRYMVIFTDQRS